MFFRAVARCAGVACEEPSSLPTLYRVEEVVPAVAPTPALTDGPVAGRTRRGVDYHVGTMRAVFLYLVINNTLA